METFTESLVLVREACGKNRKWSLRRISELGMLPLEETEIPYLYSVNQTEAGNQVMMFRHDKTDRGYSTSEEVYDLENVLVTDEEIIIEYEGQTETFKRLSKSVAENEDKVQYEYRSSSTQ